MRRVYKYPLALGAPVKLQIGDSQILHVGLDPKGYVCLWTLFDSDRPDGYDRTFLIVGTGHEIPSYATKYIGTVHQGAFIWHCFECPGV